MADATDAATADTAEVPTADIDYLRMTWSAAAGVERPLGLVRVVTDRLADQFAIVPDNDVA
jgi:hypothetical protein